MGRYKLPTIKELRNQLLYAPPRARTEHITRLEKLLEELSPEATYPYDYVLYRVTLFRSENPPNVTFTGDELRHDLALLLLDLSGSLDTPVSQVPEPVCSIEELCRLYNISTKTLSRWRADGLIGRKYIFPDAKKKTGFRLSHVRRYVEAHAQRVARSRKFSRMTPQEKDLIVRRAREYAARDHATMSEIVRRLARLTGRSREAIRSTIRTHDKENPENAVFKWYFGPLTEQRKAEIARLFEQGVSVKSLMRKYRRSRSAIYAIVNEQRMTRLLSSDIKYIYNPEFDAPDAERKILSRGVDFKVLPTDPPRLRDARLSEAAVYLSQIYRTPLLTSEQETAIFRAYNYCKYRVCKIQEELKAGGPKARLIKEAELLLNKALACKERIIKANLRLVASVARKHAGPLANLLDLISDGNVCLLKAVEKFDYSRGNKFSTYLTWALMKNFARQVPEENYRSATFIRRRLEALGTVPVAEAGGSAIEEAETAEVTRQMLNAVLQKLSARERRIIASRYGLDKRSEPQTLSQIGRKFGVSKERVRQIEARALDKLRALLVESALNPESS